MCQFVSQRSGDWTLVDATGPPSQGGALSAIVEHCQTCGCLLDDDQIMQSYGIFAVLYRIMALFPAFGYNLDYDQELAVRAEAALDIMAPTSTSLFGTA